MATLYDICKKTGFSTATVSRVINGSSQVTEKTRQTVLDAMKELNYQPNQAARMLAGKKTDTIGVMFPEIDNGFYVKVLRGIDVAAKEAGLHLLTAFYHDTEGLKKTLPSLAMRGRTDAVVLMNNSLSDEQIEKLANKNVPVVLIGHSSEASEKFDVVGIDNFSGALAAVDHLIEQEREKILLMTGPKENFDSMQRLAGARRSFEEANKDFFTASVIEAGFTYDSGKEAMELFLEDNPAPDAIFAFNDRMALGAIEAMKKSGLTIPEDVAVIGFDDSEISLYAGLSSIRVPMRDIGYEAANLAIRRIGKKSITPASITIKTSLTKRGSTGN